jgi:hypothetical protein
MYGITYGTERLTLGDVCGVDDHHRGCRRPGVLLEPTPQLTDLGETVDRGK